VAEIVWVVVLGSETNLQVLKPSRKKPRPGDIFVMQLPDRRYIFGRVVRTDAVVGPMKNVVVIYIFRFHSRDRDLPDRSEFRPSNLLVPPVMTNLLPWSRGYFETIAHLSLGTDEMLSRHCLRSWDGKYYDEFGIELPRPIQPVGDAGLHSYRTIDDLVSDALGLERAPE